MLYYLVGNAEDARDTCLAGPPEAIRSDPKVIKAYLGDTATL